MTSKCVRFIKSSANFWSTLYINGAAKNLSQLKLQFININRSSSLLKKGKKICHLYSASSEMPHFWSAQRGSHSFLHCKYTMPPLPYSSPEGATTEWTVIAPADEAIN